MVNHAGHRRADFFANTVVIIYQDHNMKGTKRSLSRNQPRLGTEEEEKSAEYPAQLVVFDSTATVVRGPQSVSKVKCMCQVLN